MGNQPGEFRVWCISWADTEEQGKSYPDRPKVAGLVEQIIANDSWALDAGNAAEMYADFVHRNRDGWESNWPLRFRVRSPDGSITDFEVEREFEPEFSARVIREHADAV